VALSLFRNPARGLLGIVGDDQVSPGALDAQHGFGDGAAAVAANRLYRA